MENVVFNDQKTIIISSTLTLLLYFHNKSNDEIHTLNSENHRDETQKDPNIVGDDEEYSPPENSINQGPWVQGKDFITSEKIIELSFKVEEDHRLSSGNTLSEDKGEEMSVSKGRFR